MTTTQITAAQATALENLKAAGTIDWTQVSCQAAQVNGNALRALVRKGLVTTSTREAVTVMRNGQTLNFTQATVSAA
jgi:hypothetical protein